jgi:hypothetical protein
MGAQPPWSVWREAPSCFATIDADAAANRLAASRVAWYFSISAPGAFLIPLQLTSIFYTNWSRWDKGSGLVFVAIMILVMFLPIYWIAPIVFFKQCRDLKRRRFVRVDKQAYLIRVVLVALYLWGDLATKIAQLLAET